MLWLLKDVGLFILGIASLYLVSFGALPDKTKDEEDESRQIRVWIT